MAWIKNLPKRKSKGNIGKTKSSTPLVGKYKLKYDATSMLVPIYHIIKILVRLMLTSVL